MYGTKAMGFAYAQPILLNRNEDPRGQRERFLMAGAEIVAESRFHEPAELAVRGRPERELERHLGGDRSGLEIPFGSATDHELDFVRQIERLLEQQVGAPLRAAPPKQRCHAG